jgi:hypothetical protein
MSDDLWLNDKEIMLWARYDLWRLKDAIMLIHGMKPNTDTGVWCRPDGFDGEASYDDIMRMAKSANKAGRLTFQGEGRAMISPVEFIAWAKAKMLTVNAELERAVTAFHKTREGAPTVVADQTKCEAQEGSSSGEHKPRRRLDNLGRAVLDALNHLPPKPTLQQVFDYLATKDDTGYIRGRDADELIWENSQGGQSRTSEKALANRLPRLIREHKAAR